MFGVSASFASRFVQTAPHGLRNPYPYFCVAGRRRPPNKLSRRLILMMCLIWSLWFCMQPKLMSPPRSQPARSVVSGRVPIPIRPSFPSSHNRPAPPTGPPELEGRRSSPGRHNFSCFYLERSFYPRPPIRIRFPLFSAVGLLCLGRFSSIANCMGGARRPKTDVLITHLPT